MATIKLDTLKKSELNKQGFTYSDLKLDLEFNYTVNNELLKSKEIKDSVNSLDYDAIRNSIVNLFTTIPGQKILNPYFGLNLMQYVFEAVSIENGRIIGEVVSDGIATFEPRIKLNNINVFCDEENNQYKIDMIIAVPNIYNRTFRFVGTLTNSGFYLNN